MHISFVTVQIFVITDQYKLKNEIYKTVSVCTH